MRRKRKSYQSYELYDSKTGVRQKVKSISTEIIQSSESHPVPEARHNWSLSKVARGFLKLVEVIASVITIISLGSPSILDLLLRHIFFIKKDRKRIGFFCMQAV